MTIFSFFGLLLLTAAFHLFSFMGVVFAFAGLGDGNPGRALQLTTFFKGLADVLIQLHLYVAPVYYLAIIAVFFWGSKELAATLAKSTFALPSFSFVTIFLFFLFMPK